MTDPVLSVRIDALEKTLRGLNQEDRTLADCIELGDPRLEAIRKGLDQAMRTQAKRRLEDLKESRDILDKAALEGDNDARQKLLAAAWRSYAEACQRSGVFFSECLEIIGGLVFRNMRMQERIYLLADELARQCAHDVLRSSVALTLPSLPETLVKTLARIIGLRFPSWTIWNLPMTAHELGHVLMQESEDEFLAKFVDGLVSEWANDGDHRQVERYVQELVADAFGTYVMGPAYACSTVLLAFDPLSAHREEEGRPSDAKRAHAVFAMLRQMPDMLAECQFQIDQVEEEWKVMLRRVGQPDTVDKNEAKRLEKLVVDIEQGFGRGQLLRFGAKYPKQGWLLAKAWGTSWEKALNTAGEPLTITRDEIPPSSRLRDVLNAAWYCRLQRRKASLLGEVDKIAEAAHELCEQVIDVRKKDMEELGKQGSSVRITSPSR